MGINTLKKMGLFPFPDVLHSRFLMRKEWLNGVRMWGGGGVVSPCFLVFLFFSILSGRAEAIDVTFSTTITPTPCTVALTGGNDGATGMSFGSLNSDDITRPNSSPVHVFHLALSDCGVDATTAPLFKPVITVSGDGGTIGEKSDYVYRAPTSTSKGFGFFMNFNNTQVKWNATGVPSGDVANVNTSSCNKITTTNNTCGARLPDDWWSRPIDIAVAATSTLNAGDSYLQAGTVIANVRFTFDYP